MDATIEDTVFPFIRDGLTISGDGIPENTTLTLGDSPNITLSNSATASGTVLSTINNYSMEVTT